jgi:hypothetical protein
VSETPVNLTELLESVIFEGDDPRIQKLKGEWEEAQRTEQRVFERVLEECYEQRLDYHQICRTPNPEEAARNDRTAAPDAARGTGWPAVGHLAGDSSSDGGGAGGSEGGDGRAGMTSGVPSLQMQWAGQRRHFLQYSREQPQSTTEWPSRLWQQ